MRVGSDELDIVAFDGETLVVVEVRYRRGTTPRDALLSLTPTKQKRLRRAALGLLERWPFERELRVDLAAVCDRGFELLENVLTF